MNTSKQSHNHFFRAKRFLAIFLAASILLAGCGGAPTPTATPWPTWTPIPTVRPLPDFNRPPAPPTPDPEIAGRVAEFCRSYKTGDNFVIRAGSAIYNDQEWRCGDFVTAEEFPTPGPVADLPRYCKGDFESTRGTFYYRLAESTSQTFYVGDGRYVVIECHPNAQGASPEEYLTLEPEESVLTEAQSICEVSPENYIGPDGTMFVCDLAFPFAKFMVTMQPQGVEGKISPLASSDDAYWVIGCKEYIVTDDTPDGAWYQIALDYEDETVWIPADTISPETVCIAPENLAEGRMYRFFYSIRSGDIPYFNPRTALKEGTLPNGVVVKFLRFASDNGAIYFELEGEEFTFYTDYVWYGVQVEP